jgi:hypothetical protein
MIDLTEVTTRHEFRVFAMKRSGHHAVMSWLMAHYAGPVYFLNNCSFTRQTLFSSTRVGRFHEQAAFSGRVSIFLDGGKVVRRAEHLPKQALLDQPEERLARLTGGEQEFLAAFNAPRVWDAYFYNLEDFDLAHRDAVPFSAAARGRAEQIHNVIILRDPFNWLASRMKGGFPIDADVIAAWVSQCREALGETSKLEAPLVVNYDRWFSNEDYRRDLSRQLGYVGSDPGIGETANFGGGSSFSGLEFGVRADQMDVLNRWKVLQDDPDYRAFFRDADELLDLARRYFPDGPRPTFLD